MNGKLLTGVSQNDQLVVLKFLRFKYHTFLFKSTKYCFLLNLMFGFRLAKLINLVKN